MNADRAGLVTYEIDNVYYNVTKSNETNKPILASYFETFAIPLLDIANNFIFTVVRMKMPSSSIPIFIFQDNQYIVTVQHPTGTLHQAPVVYIPQNNVNTVPENRFIFSYNAFIEMVNVAINTAATAAGLTPPDIPFIVYNPVTKLFELYASTAGWTGPAPHRLWFNSKLFNYFSAFDAFSNGYVENPVNPIDFCNYQIKIRDTITNVLPIGTLPTPYSGIEMIKVTAEYDILFSWTDAARILIVSQSFPNNPENIGSRDQSGRTVTESILVDFEIGTLPTFKEYIFYNNQYSYPTRWVNLLSNGPLKTFGFTVYWQSNSGEKYPLYLNPLYELSLKIQFTRKPSTYGLTHLPQDLVQIPGWERSKTAQDSESLRVIKTGEVPKIIGAGRRK